MGDTTRMDELEQLNGLKASVFRKEGTVNIAFDDGLVYSDEIALDLMNEFSLQSAISRALKSYKSALKKHIQKDISQKHIHQAAKPDAPVRVLPYQLPKHNI